MNNYQKSVAKVFFVLVLLILYVFYLNYLEKIGHNILPNSNKLYDISLLGSFLLMPFGFTALCKKLFWSNQKAFWKLFFIFLLLVTILFIMVFYYAMQHMP